MNSTDKIQLVIDEIALDTAEFLRRMSPDISPNELFLSLVAATLEGYLNSKHDIQLAHVICDSSNNEDELLENGEMMVDLLFIVDHVSLRATFTVVRGTYTRVDHEFFVKIKVGESCDCIEQEIS
jgi:hypothetical protein